VIIAKNISPGLQNNSASQKEVYFRRAAPGEGGAHSGAVGGPGGNILFCDAESLCGYLKISFICRYLRKFNKKDTSVAFEKHLFTFALD